MEHRLFIQDDRKVDRIKAGGLSAPSKKIKSNHEPLALEKAKAGAKEPCSSTYGLHIKTQAYHRLMYIRVEIPVISHGVPISRS